MTRQWSAVLDGHPVMLEKEIVIEILIVLETLSAAKIIVDETFCQMLIVVK